MTVAEKWKAKLAKDVIPDNTQLEMTADAAWVEKVDLKRRLDAVVKWAEAKRKELAQDIEIALISEGVEAVRWDGCLVKQGKGRTADKLSPTRLVELGVSIDVIAQATEEGKPYTFAQIVVPKGEQVLPSTWAELEAMVPEYDG